MVYAFPGTRVQIKKYCSLSWMKPVRNTCELFGPWPRFGLWKFRGGLVGYGLWRGVSRFQPCSEKLAVAGSG